ncbi:MAG: hypothetical protein OEY14_00475 [Myxococcales bacterium]|nr:hypothetical protein [Myxococcales bacterium]
MILELILLAAAGAAGTLAWSRVGGRGARAERGGEEPAGGGERVRGEGLDGLSVSDVILYLGDELWLAGVITLEEEETQLRLFVAPDGERRRWIARLGWRQGGLGILEPCAEVPEGRIPESLPIAGRRLRLARRGEAEVEREGEELPCGSGRARFSVLEGAGGRLLIVVDFEEGRRLALHGERIREEMLQILPGR